LLRLRSVLACAIESPIRVNAHSQTAEIKKRVRWLVEKTTHFIITIWTSKASVYYDKNTGAIGSNQSMFERSDVSIVKTLQTAKLPILVTRSLFYLTHSEITQHDPVRNDNGIDNESMSIRSQNQRWFGVNFVNIDLMSIPLSFFTGGVGTTKA